MRLIRYANTASEPAFLDLTAHYIVFDGIHNSTVANLTINVEPVNDNVPQVMLHFICKVGKRFVFSHKVPVNVLLDAILSLLYYHGCKSTPRVRWPF